MSSPKITLETCSRVVITFEMDSNLEITLKIVTSPKITQETCSRIVIEFEMDSNFETTLKIVPSPKITHKQVLALNTRSKLILRLEMSLAIKLCTNCVVACFQDVFGSKNEFQVLKLCIVSLFSFSGFPDTFCFLLE